MQKIRRAQAARKSFPDSASGHSRSAKGRIEFSNTTATHLSYGLRQGVDELLRSSMNLRRAGGFIVTVMDPDPLVWDGAVQHQEELFSDDEARIEFLMPFPLPLQARFAGPRYAQLETTEFLDHPGAELVLIAE